MKVSIISPDISSNAMARTCTIVEAISINYDIEVLGFDEGDGFFEPFADAFNHHSFSSGKTPVGLYKGINKLVNDISGDIVYAFRPHMGSLGAGILKKYRTGIPLILDVDDLVRFNEYPVYQQLYNSILFSGSPTSGAYAKAIQRLSSKADAITVSSSYLRDKYVGKILPYGPRAGVFDPNSVPPHSDIESEYPNSPVLMFIGTVREHKGLDTLVLAANETRHDITVVIAGYDPDNQIAKLESLSDTKLDYRGPITREEVPEYLAAADIVPLPQKSTEYTRAQVPKKLFEAMSMGKPIIASRIGDLPTILADCGRLVPPEDPQALASSIDNLLDNKATMNDLGRMARKRYEGKYSFNILCERVNCVLTSLL